MPKFIKLKVYSYGSGFERLVNINLVRIIEKTTLNGVNLTELNYGPTYDEYGKLKGYDSICVYETVEQIMEMINDKG